MGQIELRHDGVLGRSHSRGPGRGGSEVRAYVDSIALGVLSRANRAAGYSRAAAVPTRRLRGPANGLLGWPRFSCPTSSVALRFTPLKRCSGASVVRP